MTSIGHKTIVITGGASGIGRLTALEMVRRGGTICVWDVDKEGLDAVVEELREAGGGRDAYGVVCDVSDRAAVTAAAAATVAAAGPVHILINNAGVVSGRTLLELTDEQIERTMSVNTMALFWVTRAFLPDMVARGSGHIVTIASAAGLIGVARQTDYGASKSAAIGFDEALRFELRRLAPGVVTTVLCPFYVDTGMFAGTRTRLPLLLPILKERDVARAVVRAVQLNRRRMVIPPFAKATPLLRVLPVPVFDRVAQLLGVAGSMDDFTGRPA